MAAIEFTIDVPSSQCAAQYYTLITTFAFFPILFVIVALIERWQRERVFSRGTVLFFAVTKTIVVPAHVVWLFPAMYYVEESRSRLHCPTLLIGWGVLNTCLLLVMLLIVLFAFVVYSLYHRCFGRAHRAAQQAQQQAQMQQQVQQQNFVLHQTMLLHSVDRKSMSNVA